MINFKPRTRKNPRHCLMFLTDIQLEQLERNPEFRQYGRECPVCRGTNKYKFQGTEYECPDDDLGHPMLRLAKVYWLANIGLQYQQLDFANWHHPEFREDIEGYIEKYEFLRLSGVGITLYSKALGVGKTWAATYILKELVKKGTEGWFVPFWEIMNYKDIEDWAEKNYKVKKLQETELVVIDDIKMPYSDRQREYFGDKLEEFIRPRTDSNLPTIITTNMSEKQLESQYPRIFSLMCAKNMFLELTGTDARVSGNVWKENIELAMNEETRPIT